MKLVLSACATAFLAASFQLQAAERTFADVYSDCGIGAMIFNSGAGSESGRTLAIISNATWDLGTTAHSSNAMSPENCQGSAASTASFLYHSYDQIETDLAQGGGEHIDALLHNLSCSVAKEDVVTGLRTELSISLDASNTKVDKAGTVYDTLTDFCAV